MQEVERCRFLRTLSNLKLKWNRERDPIRTTLTEEDPTWVASLGVWAESSGLEVNIFGSPSSGPSWGEEGGLKGKYVEAWVCRTSSFVLPCAACVPTVEYNPPTHSEDLGSCKPLLRQLVPSQAGVN